ncbi:MAG: hypothetical protein D6718_01955 [Acidobacteria bacterium]|nr:MAG: hypothetical protein D6718_01955 [Acidobacteriota bacterium]
MKLGLWLFPLPFVLLPEEGCCSCGGNDGEETCRGGGEVDPLAWCSALLPPEVRGHLTAARLELLRAARALIDSRIAGLEGRKARRRAEKIPVEGEDEGPGSHTAQT